MLYHFFAQVKTDFALTRGLRSCQQFSRIGNISHSIASFTPDRLHQRSKVKFVCTYGHVISIIYIPKYPLISKYIGSSLSD